MDNDVSDDKKDWGDHEMKWVGNEQRVLTWQLVIGTSRKQWCIELWK